MKRALIVAITFTLCGCREGMIYGGPPDDGGTDGGGGGIGGGVGGGGGGGGSGDLPCDITALLSQHCGACHGATPTGGAPMALDTRAQLAAPSPIYAGQNYAQRSLTRMQQAAAEMPPSPAARVSATEINAFQSWVQAGLPAGSCELDGGTPSDGGEPDAGPVDAGVGGLPCDVAALVEAKCVSCHRQPPAGGAPFSLTQYADFTQSSPGYPGQTVAQRCLVRVQELAAPMPPTPNAPVTPAEVAVLAAWIDAGTPLGSCGELDGGTGPFPTTCASGTWWTQGNQENPLMNPGRACVSCHAQTDPEKAYFFMGTVYPAFHEKDLCDAPPPTGGQVEIIDANGNTALTLTPNSSGNFYSQSSSAGLALPYTARVVANGNTRAMATPQTSGDCNTCHTEQGVNGAPGRITWP